MVRVKEYEGEAVYAKLSSKYSMSVISADLDSTPSEQSFLSVIE